MSFNIFVRFFHMFLKLIQVDCQAMAWTSGTCYSFPDPICAGNSVVTRNLESGFQFPNILCQHNSLVSRSLEVKSN